MRDLVNEVSGEEEIDHDIFENVTLDKVSGFHKGEKVRLLKIKKGDEFVVSARSSNRESRESFDSEKEATELFEEMVYKYSLTR